MFNKNSILAKYGPATPTSERDPRPGSGANVRISATNAASGSLTGGEPKPTLPPMETQGLTLPNPPAGTAEDEAGSRLVVGPNVKLKGAEIDDCDILVVEGRVEATMDSRVLRVAENGAFAGKVGIDVAEVRGHFDGELTARNQLIIHSTGRVSGTIRYGKIRVEEGGELSGDIRALSPERDRVGEAGRRSGGADLTGIKSH